MKKKLFFIIIFLMSILGLKVYAKPIMPPADDVPTPYIEKLGGNAIYEKTIFTNPEELGYCYYIMPYSICLVESSSLWLKLSRGESAKITLEKKESKEYSVSEVFVSAYNNTYNTDFGIYLGGKRFNLASNYTHTFSESIINEIRNQTSNTFSFTETISENVTATEDGYYFISMLTFFDVYVIQEFYVNMVNGYPQKVASGNYDVVIAKSKRYNNYHIISFRNENKITKEETVQNNIIYVDNASVKGCINGILNE